MKRIISAAQRHRGELLISGGICLKAGAMLGSIAVAGGGYIILAVVCGLYIKKWRDES